MLWDILLAIVALAVAVVGTLSDHLTDGEKGILIGLAVLTCIFASIKAIGDDHDKKFMKVALIANLVPDNSSYAKLTPEIEAAGEKRHFDDSPCHHSSDGMACFFSSKSDNSIHATVVLNRSEIAQMYANDLDKTSNDRLSKTVFDRIYKPIKGNDWDEEFVDKAGILAMAVCYSMFDRWGSDYNYDPKFGLKAECETHTGRKEAHITTEELTTLHSGPSSAVFYKLEQMFRDQYKPSM
jgi:hypothetical protein